MSDGVGLCKALGEDAVELSLWMEEIVVGVEEEDRRLGGHLRAGCAVSMEIKGPVLRRISEAFIDSSIVPPLLEPYWNEL